MADQNVRSGVHQDHPPTQRVNMPDREEGLVRAGAEPVEHERPEQWGWHGHMGKWGRWLIWLPIFQLIGFNFTNARDHINNAWLGGIVALLIAVFIWDWRRRKNAWRTE